MVVKGLPVYLVGAPVIMIDAQTKAPLNGTEGDVEKQVLEMRSFLSKPNWWLEKVLEELADGAIQEGATALYLYDVDHHAEIPGTGIIYKLRGAWA
ncbi:hypothetical protein OLCHANIL_00111 [Vibrio phage V05]|uniref:Uncharacterized protein n=1 Tax=Vibrio phage VH1_2019 TaxID=2686307 RepID=A0A6B9SVS2_9CAUD|nr:hypothetical protein VH12019_00071 [Vibrio phage VH1_2019]QIW90208.1 hypothetical protein OLCHANIL_00111 [Vibrio phage V05]WOL24751.1 hypothetical protein [Vibrio phage PG216]